MRARFEQPFQRQPARGREVLDSTVPGGLNVFFGPDKSSPTLNYESDSGLTGSVPLDSATNSEFEVLPGESFTVTYTVVNQDSTDTPLSGSNPDSCNFGDSGGLIGGEEDGTSIKVVSQVSGSLESSTQCVEDLYNRNTPATATYSLTHTAPDQEDTYTMNIRAEGGSSGTRLTPIYGVDVVVTENADDSGTGSPDDPDDGGIAVTPPEYIELGEARFQQVVNVGDEIRFDIDIVSNWGAQDGIYAPGNHPDYCAAGALNVRPGGNVTAEVSINGFSSDGSSVCVNSAEDITQVETLLNAPTTPGTYDVTVNLVGTNSGVSYGSNTYNNVLEVRESDPDLSDPGDDPDPGDDQPGSDPLDELLPDSDLELYAAGGLGGLFLLVLLIALLK